MGRRRRTTFDIQADVHAVADVPGTDTDGVGPSEVKLGSIIPVVGETGKISLSVDGLGTNAFAGGLIQVNKPAGATVRRAYFTAASTGFTNRKLNNTDVKIDGAAVTWDLETPSSISSWNHWADVTTMVKPKIDAAGAGIVNFTITEVLSPGIDGEILAVIFDDPAQTTDNTVVLLFGAQAIAGDNFFVNLADPIDTSDPDLVVDMGLGISYGFQPSGQVSLVDVNGTRLTSSAGGQDDGAGANGALLTVGGWGDLNNNPPPFAAPANARTDDELYDLLPFVTDGDIQISVFTRNPSNDDNIFFASFFLTVEATVTPEPDPNNRPTADASATAQLHECAGDATAVQLDGSLSDDIDGTIEKWEWLDDSGQLITTGETATVDLSLGVHVITLRVEDNDGADDETIVRIVIEDTTPPDLSFNLDRTVLWPPNHKMRKGGSGVATDACQAGGEVVTVTVTSNEPINDRGDGNTDPDWEVQQVDSFFDVFVRAERDGRGSGRVYMISAVAEDPSGNSTLRVVREVSVPHDRGKRGRRGRRR
jgi:hypothetical protein